jgi:hypothetical protein
MVYHHTNFNSPSSSGSLVKYKRLGGIRCEPQSCFIYFLSSVTKFQVQTLSTAGVIQKYAWASY